MPDEAPLIRLDEKFQLTGFVLTEDVLRNVEVSAAHAVSAAKGEHEAASSVVSVTTVTQAQVEFSSTESLLAYLSHERVAIKDLDLVCRKTDEAIVSVSFSNSGEIRISGYDRDHDFPFKLARLRRTVEFTDPNYSALVKAVVIKDHLRGLLSTLVVLFSVVLLAVLLVPLLAFLLSSPSRSADHALYISPDEYHKEIAQALKSRSPEQKLDVLLRAQMVRDPSTTINRNDLLNTILALSISLLVLLIVSGVLREITKTYPKAFFALGSAKGELRKLEGRRELWVTGVAIAFFVNLLAGIAIALIMR